MLIWVRERFPQQPPTVFVRPTVDMVLKLPHPYMDASGLVQTPCLKHWAPGCTIMYAISEMAALLGINPPVFMRISAPPGPEPSAWYSALITAATPAVALPAAASMLPRPPSPLRTPTTLHTPQPAAVAAPDGSSGVREALPAAAMPGQPARNDGTWAVGAYILTTICQLIHVSCVTSAFVVLWFRAVQMNLSEAVALASIY